MGSLSHIGRIFYGMAIAGMGILAIFYRRLPYVLSPARGPVPAIVFGIVCLVAGAAVIVDRKPAALVLGVILLAIGCFYCIPHVPNYLSLPEWENAAKVLALGGGALALVKGKTGHFGAVLFAITIVDFGILHFIEAKAAAGYIPSWIPWHLFWMYFCGAALIASGIAVLLNTRQKLAAVLLGSMVLTWFVVLHLPRVRNATTGYMDGEVFSALLALAYSGIAFVISGSTNKGTRK
jgi:uncharacterized membrane protein